MDLWVKHWQKYKDFILKNPELTGELESGFKWTSYLLTSRSRGSAFISELTYCASNLLVLINDLVFEQYVNSLKLIPSIPEQTIRKFLTILNCVEVLAEITSRKVAGPSGKWIVVTCIQIVKTICRLILLLKYKVGIIPTLSLPFLNRRAMVQYLKKGPPRQTAAEAVKEPPQVVTPPMTFTLQSTGRTVRTIAAAPSSSNRTWKLPEAESPTTAIQDPLKLAAELVYTARPLAHLMTMGMFGQKSWKPWLVAFSMDIASLNMLSRILPASMAEKREIQQRKMLMLFYLLRSPFYDNYSKQKVLWLLNGLRRKMAIANFLWNPLADYAEKWEKMYFYSWDP